MLPDGCDGVDFDDSESATLVSESPSRYTIMPTLNNTNKKTPAPIEVKITALLGLFFFCAMGTPEGCPGIPIGFPKGEMPCPAEGAVPKGEEGASPSGVEATDSIWAKSSISVPPPNGSKTTGVSAFGMANGFLQEGQRTRLPANLSLATNRWPQEQDTLMGICFPYHRRVDKNVDCPAATQLEALYPIKWDSSRTKFGESCILLLVKTILLPPNLSKRDVEPTVRADRQRVRKIWRGLSDAGCQHRND